jgi:signal transduction histidine kinase
MSAQVERGGLISHGATPTAATIGGALVAGAIVAVSLAHGDLSRGVQALCLVVPVVGAAALGGRYAGYAVGVVATLCFTLVVPPIGSPRVGIQADLAVVIAFSVVVVLIGILVAGRVDALRRMEHHQTALLRAVSHDLRTPLASIQAVLSELEVSGLYTDAERAELAHTANREAGRLDRLVANLLSLARIQGGALRPAKEAVDLPDLVQRTARRLEFALAQAEFVVQLDAEVPLVRADPALVEQVITNLLENGARHSPAGAPVTVVVSRAGAVVRVEVLDEGPGLARDDAAHVFEPFRSGARPGASGVGLAICKAIVEAHRGSIVATNRSDGGACFVVELPVG